MCDKCTEIADLIIATENDRTSYVEWSFPYGEARLVVPDEVTPVE
jgi:hypothetical protein